MFDTNEQGGQETGEATERQEFYITDAGGANWFLKKLALKQRPANGARRSWRGVAVGGAPCRCSTARSFIGLSPPRCALPTKPPP